MTTTRGTTPVLEDPIDQALAGVPVDDLLHAVVTEMNAIYPDNVLQNGRLLVTVEPDGVDAIHPEWAYTGDPLRTSTLGASLRDALLAAVRAMRAGHLRPVRGQDD
jgi:hypothetical protein